MRRKLQNNPPMPTIYRKYLQCTMSARSMSNLRKKIHRVKYANDRRHYSRSTALYHVGCFCSLNGQKTSQTKTTSSQIKMSTFKLVSQHLHNLVVLVQHRLLLALVRS